jgi:hypothetical protein
VKHFLDTSVLILNLLQPEKNYDGGLACRVETVLLKTGHRFFKGS